MSFLGSRRRYASILDFRLANLRVYTRCLPRTAPRTEVGEDGHIREEAFLVGQGKAQGQDDFAEGLRAAGLSPLYRSMVRGETPAVRASSALLIRRCSRSVLREGGSVKIFPQFTACGLSARRGLNIRFRVIFCPLFIWLSAGFYPRNRSCHRRRRPLLHR